MGSVRDNCSHTLLVSLHYRWASSVLMGVASIKCSWNVYGTSEFPTVMGVSLGQAWQAFLAEMSC